MFRFTMVLAACLSFALAADRAAAQSAMGQLIRATNGTQHTGTTFDGSGSTPRGPIDTPVRR